MPHYNITNSLARHANILLTVFLLEHTHFCANKMTLTPLLTLAFCLILLGLDIIRATDADTCLSACADWAVVMLYCRWEYADRCEHNLTQKFPYKQYRRHDRRTVDQDNQLLSNKYQENADQPAVLIVSTQPRRLRL